MRDAGTYRENVAGQETVFAPATFVLDIPPEAKGYLGHAFMYMQRYVAVSAREPSLANQRYAAEAVVCKETAGFVLAHVLERGCPEFIQVGDVS